MELITPGLKNVVGSVDLKFLPTQIGGVKAWHRFNTGLTETGLGLSQWDDVSGNGNHQKQGTDLDKPQIQSDGSILYDGIRQFTKADAFTFEQPEIIFLLCKLITWTALDRLFDGNTATTGLVRQKSGGVSPELEAYAGSLVFTNSDLALNTYGIVEAVFNGASSSLRINNNAPSTGNAGIVDMNGLTLAASGGGGSFANIQVMEMIAYSANLSANELQQIRNYLALVGGLSI